jgi:predicted PurR-regulated permease PerM
VLLPPLFALVQFDTFVPAIILLAALNAINFVVANIVLPRMQGESLNLDPVVVLFSLALWTMIWGLPGAFLSTPLTVTAMVVLAQFPSSRWIAVLLSGNGDPDSSGEKSVAEPHEEKKKPASRKRDGSGVKPKPSSPI